MLLNIYVSVCVCVRWRVFMYILPDCLCMQIYVCANDVFVCVWWACMCVNTVCALKKKKKKKKSWDESGAAHVETLSAERVSMRSIMRQG